MRYVCGTRKKAKPVPTNPRLKCEARGVDIYTLGGIYLGTAGSEAQAIFWAACPDLLKMCERTASGDTKALADLAILLVPLAQAG